MVGAKKMIRVASLMMPNLHLNFPVLLIGKVPLTGWLLLHWWPGHTPNKAMSGVNAGAAVFAGENGSENNSGSITIKVLLIQSGAVFFFGGGGDFFIRKTRHYF